MRPPRNGGRVLSTACLDLLCEIGPMTVAELAALRDRVPSVIRWELAAHRKAKRVHVLRWDRPPFRGGWCPVYAAFPGKDAPRPARATPSVANRRYRARQAERASGLLWANPWR